MEGRNGQRRTLRLNDPLGHMVPPGQILPSDLTRALVRSLDDSVAATRSGRPAASRFLVRMHPADRAWLPAGFERDLARILTEHADTSDLAILDGIEVRFEPDPACDLGHPSVFAGSRRQLSLDEPELTRR